MPIKIGVLLPRSTDYPAMGFDILDALKWSLKKAGHADVQYTTENIGYGEDHEANHAKAEKMFLQDDVACIVAYCNTSNAEPLYKLAETAGRPIIFLDPGMQYAAEKPQQQCFYISLQSLHACRIAGQMAGERGMKVLMAISFYEGGYRAPYSTTKGLEEAGAEVCGNYVSPYKISAFNIDQYLQLLQTSGAESIVACFSTYLLDLFMKALKTAAPDSVRLPFFCSPFMAEEQILEKMLFPGGEFNVITPWSHTLVNDAQATLAATVKTEKNKQTNIFHLLGWEAGIVVSQVLAGGINSLAGWSYESPRGLVTFHPETQQTYAPLYTGMIVNDGNENCKVLIKDTISIDAASHVKVQAEQPEEGASGWKNNYLCI
jgi:branched-chain amino acid transport system substrate-binding protein